MTYSNSSISCFETCPRKFKFTYIEKPPIVKKESIEAFLGNRVHDTFKKLYTDVQAGKVCGLNELIIFFNKVWDENWKPEIEIKKKEYTSYDYKKSGEDCITMYCRRYYPFDTGTVVDLENKYYFNLDKHGKYKFMGILDRVMKIKDGYYEIHDYKTTAKKNFAEGIENDIQLPLYQVGLGSKFPDVKKVDLIWHFLRFDITIKKSFDSEYIENIKMDTIKTIERIEAETEFRTKESPLCGWCDYIELCPAK